ncbi:MAG TPA: hypothetical protein VIM18_03880, partial [Solirubrobacteraceae bacterium]
MASGRGVARGAGVRVRMTLTLAGVAGGGALTVTAVTRALGASAVVVLAAGVARAAPARTAGACARAG